MESANTSPSNTYRVVSIERLTGHCERVTRVRNRISRLLEQFGPDWIHPTLIAALNEAGEEFDRALVSYDEDVTAAPTVELSGPVFAALIRNNAPSGDPQESEHGPVVYPQKPIVDPPQEPDAAETCENAD